MPVALNILLLHIIPLVSLTVIKLHACISACGTVSPLSVNRACVLRLFKSYVKILPEIVGNGIFTLSVSVFISPLEKETVFWCVEEL